MKKLIIFFVLINLLSIKFIYSQNEYYDKKQLRYEDKVYVNNFATVLLYKNGFELSNPYIALNSDQQLRLSFDDLNSGTGSYAFTLIHCNNDWQPSDLMQMEYLEGMTEDYVSSNFQSFVTFTHYTHYEFLFPNNNIRITKSGNYIIKIYPEGYPDNVVITKRFYVFENKVAVVANVIRPVNPNDYYTKQELNLSINLNGYKMPNPYENLTVKIFQNQRTDNQIILKKPKGIQGNSMYFDTPGELTFEAGNEFRNFDTRSLLTATARVSAISNDSKAYHVLLLGESSRKKKNYIKYEDINGRYLIYSYDNTQISDKIEADYAWVTFSLSEPFDVEDGSIFLLGALTQWSLNPDFKMIYNPQLKAYQITLFLKQGFYDYQYVFVPNNASQGSVSKYENSFSECENEYTILVYYRDQGDIYDKLIGIQSIQSKF